MHPSFSKADRFSRQLFQDKTNRVLFFFLFFFFLLIYIINKMWLHYALRHFKILSQKKFLLREPTIRGDKMNTQKKKARSEDAKHYPFSDEHLSFSAEKVSIFQGWLRPAQIWVTSPAHLLSVWNTEKAKDDVVPPIDISRCVFKDWTLNICVQLSYVRQKQSWNYL